MLDLYLVRHAQSEMNLEAHLIGGRSNHVPLSPIGELQGSYLGKRFRNERVRFSRIYSSTAVRTQKTAHLTSHEIEFPVNKIILSEDLLELDQGDWEGQPRSEIYTSEMLAMINANNWEFTPPHGESQRMVEERMYSVVERNLLLPAPKPETVAIFGHGMAIKCLLRKILGSSPSMTYKMVLGNTSITRLQYHSNGWHFISMNDVSHLPTNLRTH